MKELRSYKLTFKLVSFDQDAGLELVLRGHCCSEWPHLNNSEKSNALFYYGRRSI